MFFFSVPVTYKTMAEIIILPLNHLGTSACRLRTGLLPRQHDLLFELTIIVNSKVPLNLRL